MQPQWAAKHIADLMKASKKTVIFTGAGMSTESGLPDFRSSGGLWEGKDPMVVAHADTLKNDPGTIARFYRDRITEYGKCKPNRGHQILAEWETQGKIWGIATQNIDGFHGQAGNKNVCELHGNMNLYCDTCAITYPTTAYTHPYDEEEFWRCSEISYTPENGIERCFGMIRPNVTLFGEDLPQQPYHRAMQHHASANLCIILGSSCSVYPANSLPRYTIDNGGEVVIINKSDTELDQIASYKISEWSITKSLEQINKFLND
jgi:NAD-dependent deacetylase